MDSSEDESGPKRTHERGKRKSGRKRKRKAASKEKSKVSCDDDAHDKSKTDEGKKVSESSKPIDDSTKNAILLLKDERAATLPRDKRSRSNSGKRTLRDLFRRSPAPGTIRSQSADRQINTEEEEEFHDASEEVNVPVHASGAVDYTRYNPTLQPRRRLGRMTVLDAVKEKQSRRSPGRNLSALEKKILTERQDGRYSSLPDISAAESSENVTDLHRGKKPKHRSKSADMPRRSTRPSKPEAVEGTSEAAASFEPNTTLETHFPSNDSESEQQTKSQASSLQNRLKLDLHNHGIVRSNSQSSVIDRNSFAESESNRRESFNRFLHLRNNLPLFSTSSIARARNYDSSPNEGNFNVLDYISEQSQPETEANNSTKSEKIQGEGKHPKSYVRCPSYEEVMREKMALEKHQPNQRSIDTDDSKQAENNIPQEPSTSKSSSSSIIENKDAKKEMANDSHVKSNSDEGLINGKMEPESEKAESGVVTERQGRARERGVFVSPRKFTGRSLSNEQKSRERQERKDVIETEQREHERNKSYSDLVHSDSKTDHGHGHSSKNSGKKFDDKIKKRDLYSKTPLPLTSNIPKQEEKENAKPSIKYKRSFSPRSKSIIKDSEKESHDTGRFRSIGVQTIDNSTISVNCKSIAINTDIDLSYEFSPVKSTKNIPVIIECTQDSNIDMDMEKLRGAELPRKLSGRSIISDQSADVGSDNDENLVFKTPEASPVFRRKALTSGSHTTDEAKTDMDIVEIADDSTNKKDQVDDKKEQEKQGNKPKGKLSILSIVALKRRLARQRKHKNETVVSRQDSEILPKIEDKDSKDQEAKLIKSDEDQELKNETKMFIENETNISLSKLAQMDETDILDDSQENDETIFPTKHISFEKGIEPITSDDPLEEDLILRERQACHRNRTRRESRMIQKRREVISCCKKFIAFLFSHIGLCSLMVAYSILGGFIFQALEAPFEENTRIKVKNVRGTVLNNIVELAFEVKLNKRNRQNLTNEVDDLLKGFQNEVYTATDLYGWNNDDEKEQSEIQWSFASSLLFAITVMTTIGYGHVAPKTNYGRIVTIAYAVLGIPLTLLCLTNIGDLMATGFRMLYSKVCCGLCCILFSPKRRRIPDPEKGIDHHDLVIQGEEKSPEIVHVPTSLCILLMTSYILLGTLLFSIWEGWDAITGTYFSFITLSTIGFGDVVPGTAMDQWASEEKLVLCAMYLVFGLSLIAMCFNLVQEDVKAKCRWLGAKIGIFDTESGV